MLHLPPLDIACIEYFYICLLFIPFTQFQLYIPDIIVGLFSSMAVIFAYYGYMFLPLHVSGICAIVHSLIVAIGSIFYFKEKASLLRIIAYSIGAYSVISIDFSISFILILISNILFAFVTLIRKFTKDFSLKMSMFFTMLFLFLYKIIFVHDIYNLVPVLCNIKVLLCAILVLSSNVMLQYAYGKHSLLILSIFGKAKPMMMLFIDGDINHTVILSFISLIIGIIDVNIYQKGLYAENKSIRYLAKYCTILAHRKRTKYGEIDIIMMDKNTLVAVEVKYRKYYTDALNAISQKQYMRIADALSVVAEEYNHIGDLRIDRVLVTQNNTISWFKNLTI